MKTDVLGTSKWLNQDGVLEYLDEVRKNMRNEIKQAPQPELLVIMQQLVRIEKLLRKIANKIDKVEP